MADTATIGHEVEGRILDTVRKGNAVALEAMKVVTDVIEPATSALPYWTPPLAYDFAEQWFASQRKFAEDVLHLTAKLTPAKPTK